MELQKIKKSRRKHAARNKERQLFVRVLQDKFHARLLEHLGMNNLTVPSIAVQDEHGSSVQGIYIEVPIITRRRRSFQISEIGEDDKQEPQATDALLPGKEQVTDIFESPRLFTELLVYSEDEGSDCTWKQAARWVRFEEDVEEGGERWSKPRVSSLYGHSVFETRSIMMRCTIALDIEASNYEEIIEKVFHKALLKEKLPQEKLPKIKDILTSQTIHLYQISKVRETSKRKALPLTMFKKQPTEKNEVNLEDNSYDDKDYKGNKYFLKKLAPGTEATNVMVGEVKCLDKALCAFVRLKDAINLGPLTEVPIPTRFLFILLGPLGELGNYCEIGRTVAALFNDDVFREVAYEATEGSYLLAGIDEFLDAAAVLPPGEWDPLIRIEPPDIAPSKEDRKKISIIEEDEDDHEIERKWREESGLTRSGRLFGGLINDIKRKVPWFWSDFKDGFSLQALATFFFLYFACLTPIVTFGGLLGEATGHNIAVIESLVAGFNCGILFGLFSGQPLTILGSTGPVLVFEHIMYDLCENLEWNYLSFRMWVGLWAALILIILVAIDASALVCYITRFTEENFATLIALIFIMKAVQRVLKIENKYPLHKDMSHTSDCNCTYDDWSIKITPTNDSLHGCIAANGTLTGQDCKRYYPDVFLLSIILFAGTFALSMQLKNLKKSSFFPEKVRSYISAFAVTIAIAIMTGLDTLIGIPTPKLYIPDQIKPTDPERGGWVVSPFNGNPWYSALLAGIPALLACILIFMDQQITAVIVNRKEHKLKKGCGYHLDLMILSLLIAINSVMGLPWFVAATVLSINHVNSLYIESECSAPGEQPQFLGVRENRLTHVMIFIFIGLSVFLAPVLKMIPMPVLFGVFLYMGISALNGIQLYERILLMLMPPKYQPDRVFLRQIRIHRIHLFTGIQIACLGVLWVIKIYPQTSILFPLMLVVMLGVRKLLDFVFTQRELKILDDILPEFSRKKIVEETEKESEDEETEVHRLSRKERSHSLYLAAGGVINMNDDGGSRKLSTSDRGSQLYLSGHTSRKSSVASSRSIRKMSMLEPIFGTPHYYQAGSPLLKIPTQDETVPYIDSDPPIEKKS